MKRFFVLCLIWAIWPVLAVEPDQAFEQAQVYYQQNDFLKAARWLFKAAEQGHVDAQSLLGSMYLIGRGVPKDATLAQHWLKEAANQGHAEAQSLLGAVYWVGQDAPQDLGQAQYWLGQAARQGLADAQYLLGMMYYQGQGVDKDVNRALQLFSQAAAQGHQAALALYKQPSASPPKPAPQPLQDKYHLTVNAEPFTSRIRIMNIKPRYEPGIALKPGQYDIYVTHPSYYSKRFWIDIVDRDVSVDVVLERK
jgi:hypothetical protein